MQGGRKRRGFEFDVFFPWCFILVYNISSILSFWREFGVICFGILRCVFKKLYKHTLVNDEKKSFFFS